MAVINTNIASLNTQRNLATNSADLQTSIQRLSSGLRINSSADDAAGLAIATRMDSQVRGSTVALRNANDAISFSQTADGALSQMTNSLQRMRDLAVQSANDTNTSGDRDVIQKEFSQLQSEVTRLQSTKFNGGNVLGGAVSGSPPTEAPTAKHTFQIGAGTTSQDTIDVTTNQLNDVATATTTISTSAATPPVTTGVGVTGTDNTNSKAAIDAIDKALTQVNGERANFGAVQNRFQSVISNLQVSIENQTASKSRIMDTDFAAETAKLSRGQILQQAGTAMLAQANSLPNGVLALLR